MNKVERPIIIEKSTPWWIKSIFLIILIALSALGGWFARDQIGPPKNANHVVSTLSPSASPTGSPATPNIIKMPELGIEIIVPDSLKDLTYEVEPLTKLEQGATGSGLEKGATGIAATLSTASLAAIDENCAASVRTNELTGTDTGGPIGNIYRIDGAPGSAYGTILLKTTNFFVIFQGSQSGCSRLQWAQQMQETDKGILGGLISINPNSISLIK